MEGNDRSFAAAVLLIGVTYAVVGVVFAWPSDHVVVWRLAAWVVSALAFAGHIGYERFWLHNEPRRAALHVALAVAIGGFGLALSANIHSFLVVTPAPQRRLLLIALAVWPILTGGPSFLVALAASAALARLTRRPAAPR